MPSHADNDADPRHPDEDQRDQAECKLAHGFVFQWQRVSSTTGCVHDVNAISIEPEWSPEDYGGDGE